jgi:DtxR family transcriptional regulator, Mn-dependent transcriptional regulator
MASFTEENYLKTIYHLAASGEGKVTTNALAEKLKTAAASVTDMLRKLSDKKLVNYKKYQGVSLTVSGRKIALKVIRKHRLWEVFLVEKLNFSWDEVHEMAEQLEHVESDELIRRLSVFLGNPNSDPHGDPIPDEDGNFVTTRYKPLAKCKTGASCVIKGVVDHRPVFLKYLDEISLKIGDVIRIVNVNEFDKSLKVEKKDGSRLSLSREVSNNLLSEEENA